MTSFWGIFQETKTSLGQNVCPSYVGYTGATETRQERNRDAGFIWAMTMATVRSSSAQLPGMWAQKLGVGSFRFNMVLWYTVNSRSVVLREGGETWRITDTKRWREFVSAWEGVARPDMHIFAVVMPPPLSLRRISWKGTETSRAAVGTGPEVQRIIHQADNPC